MANKIKIDEDTYKCPSCGYKWSRQMGMADLSLMKKNAAHVVLTAAS